MYQNETERHFELHKHEQNMSDPQNHALRIVSRKDAGQGWNWSSIRSCWRTFILRWPLGHPLGLIVDFTVKAVFHFPSHHHAVRNGIAVSTSVPLFKAERSPRPAAGMHAVMLEQSGPRLLHMLGIGRFRRRFTHLRPVASLASPTTI